MRQIADAGNGAADFAGFPGIFFQQHMFHETGQDHGRKLQGMRFDQDAEAEDKISAVHSALDQVQAHQRHDQRKDGIHLSPDGRIQDDGRVKQVSQAQEKSFCLRKLPGGNAVYQHAACHIAENSRKL